MKLIPAFISKMFHIGTAAEGQWRPTAGLGELGTMFSINAGDGFQRNLGGAPVGENATIYSLVQCYVMALGGSGLDIKRETGKGGEETVKSGAMYRVLRYPNPAQTQIEFISYLVTSLFYTGNFYAQVQRNDRFEIVALWPVPGSQKRAVMADDGSVFYDMTADYKFLNGGNTNALVPARDVLHVKLPSSRGILNGDTILTHAAATATLNSAISANAAAFNLNSSQASGFMSTDLVLTGTQMKELRDRLDEQMKGPNRGGVPILSAGMKWNAMTVSAQDAQLVETYNVSVLDLCRLFRVPPALFGLESVGAASSVEALINQWRASGLLYFAELIEEALERTFDVSGGTEIEFDLDNISRADSQTAMNILVQGVQNGVFAPNEARNKVGLDSVEYGDEPRVQAQNVRLQDAVPAPSAPAAGKAPTEDTSTDEPATKAIIVEELLARIGAANE